MQRIREARPVRGHLPANGGSAARQPRFGPEDVKDPIFSEARRRLSGATRTIFLGFGYHSANLNKLGLIEKAYGCRMYGSRIGMSTRDCSRIARSHGLRFLEAPEVRQSLTEFMDLLK